MSNRDGVTAISEVGHEAMSSFLQDLSKKKIRVPTLFSVFRRGLGGDQGRHVSHHPAS
jgi:hypothetical protein